MPFSFGTDNSTPHKSSSHTTQAPTANDAGRQLGFSNKPQVKSRDDTSMTQYRTDEGFGGFSSTYTPSGSQRRTPSAGRSGGFSIPDIPWGPIFIAVLVIGALAFLWVYREEITDFLSQLLMWVIFIAIAFAAIKWIIFGK